MRLIAFLGNAGAGKNEAANGVVAYEPNTKCIALADPMKQFAMRVFGFSTLQLWGPSEMRNALDPRFSKKWWQFWKKRKIEREFTYIKREVNSLKTIAWLRSLLPGAPEARIALAWVALNEWADEIIRHARENRGLTPRRVLQTLGTEWGRAQGENIWVAKAIRDAEGYLNDGHALVVFTDCRFINEARLIRDAGGHVWKVVRPGYEGNVAGGIEGHKSERDQNSQEIDQFVTHVFTNDRTVQDLHVEVGRVLFMHNLIE